MFQRDPPLAHYADELNPLARMELPIADEHAAAMKKLLPMEVWLH
jgi:hypothetical protein